MLKLQCDSINACSDVNVVPLRSCEQGLDETWGKREGIADGSESDLLSDIMGPLIRDIVLRVV